MTIGESVSYNLTHFFKTTGRASRSEYWWYYLFVIIITGAIGAFSGVIIHATGARGFFSFILDAIGFLLCVSVICTCIRRLHDIDKSGWNICWGLIPVLGSIYLIYLNLKPSQVGSNKYGAQPN